MLLDVSMCLSVVTQNVSVSRRPPPRATTPAEDRFQLFRHEEKNYTVPQLFRCRPLSSIRKKNCSFSEVKRYYGAKSSCRSYARRPVV
ncbi:hypothetical protein TNCV_3355431 [Trichonephila clavipes]|nr:hypothetical protein TNCV_3355431 [Trichonephila clavipes]